MQQEAQLSLGKADCTAYVRSPASECQSRRKSDLSEVTQFCTPCNPWNTCFIVLLCIFRHCPVFPK